MESLTWNFKSMCDNIKLKHAEKKNKLISKISEGLVPMIEKSMQDQLELNINSTYFGLHKLDELSTNFKCTDNDIIDALALIEASSDIKVKYENGAPLIAFKRI